MTSAATVYYCEKLRATTWDPEICKKRKAAARKAQVKPGGEPGTFWPCIRCQEKLLARPCFTCARCGVRVAGYDVEPPPSWARAGNGWLCEDCKNALFSLRPGAKAAPVCPLCSVPPAAQGSDRDLHTSHASPQAEIPPPRPGATERPRPFQESAQ